MRKIRRSVALALVAGTGLAAVTGVGSAAASTSHQLQVLKTLPGDYVGPLQFAVSGHHVAVADGFTSTLYLDGSVIAHGFGPTADPEATGDVGGVDIAHGLVAYTASAGDHSDTRFIVLKHGHQVLNVNLAKYEARANPDGHVTYGATRDSHVSAACAAALPGLTGHPVTYTGVADSHPYAVAGLPDGSWLVADAGGNDILEVSPRGHVSTLAVLPANRVKITAEVAAGLGAPECAGITYRFEGVPTDVEVTSSGIYVSSLGGGIEIGAVWKLGHHGKPLQLAGGIPGATNIAVSPSGCVYVVELGAGVFAVHHGSVTQVAALPGAAAAEWAHGRLYASTAPALIGGTDPGHVVILG